MDHCIRTSQGGRIIYPTLGETPVSYAQCVTVAATLSQLAELIRRHVLGARRASSTGCRTTPFPWRRWTRPKECGSRRPCHGFQ